MRSAHGRAGAEVGTSRVYPQGAGRPGPRGRSQAGGHEVGGVSSWPILAVAAVAFHAGTPDRSLPSLDPAGLRKGACPERSAILGTPQMAAPGQPARCRSPAGLLDGSDDREDAGCGIDR